MRPTVTPRGHVARAGSSCSASGSLPAPARRAGARRWPGAGSGRDPVQAVAPGGRPPPGRPPRAGTPSARTSRHGRAPGSGRPGRDGRARASRGTTPGRPGAGAASAACALTAPAAAIAATVASIDSSVSVRPGRIGAISTCTSNPASVNWRTASRRRRGLGVPGSTVRHIASSMKPDREADAHRRHRRPPAGAGRGRAVISVPLVRIENGLAWSRSAAMMPRMSRVPTLGPLVAVDVGAHRDVLAGPRRARPARGAAARRR